MRWDERFQESEERLEMGTVEWLRTAWDEGYKVRVLTVLMITHSIVLVGAVLSEVVGRIAD